MLYGTTSRNRVSRFIREIPENLIIEIENNIAKPIVKEIPKSKDINFKTTLTGTNETKQELKCTYVRGETVLHKKFGKGLILDAVPVGNDMKLEIAFENVGTKTLLAVYANLTKI